MKIVVENKELTFKKIDYSLFAVEKKDSDEWSATLPYKNYELDFEFSESLFIEKETGKINIDWILIEEFVKHIFENIETIQTKGSFVLEELHRQIFGEDELNKSKGYFEVAGICLKDYRKGNNEFQFSRAFFKYSASYFLESRKEILMDPYHSYEAQFSNQNDLTIIGVSRIG